FLVVFFCHRSPPGCILFPYTTLFRSRSASACRTGGQQFASLPAGRFRLRACPCTPCVLPLRELTETTRASVQPRRRRGPGRGPRSEEHTSELQSRFDLVCRLLLEQKN